MKTIVIDPGHGGADPGAIGPGGTRESDITLWVARELAVVLGEVATVTLTRSSDVDMELSDRAAVAAGADCFVSIHCNSAGDPAAHGTETYCYPGSDKGKELAGKVQAKLVEALGTTDRGVKFANFAVLRLTSCPAILVELAFINNPEEEARLNNPDFQKLAALVIGEGVAEFLGVELEHMQPEAVKTDVVYVLAGDKRLTGVMMGDVSFVPVRALCEALGKTVTWDEEERTVQVVSEKAGQ